MAIWVCKGAHTLGIKLDVMDKPDLMRKLHAQETPLVGGVAIMAAAAIYIILNIVTDEVSVRSVFGATLLSGTGVALIGHLDDRYDISPLLRMMLLLLFVFIAFAVSPRLIAGYLYWTDQWSMWVPAALYMLLLGIALIGITNAVNMMDGQNGLVISIFIVWSFCLLLIGDNAVAHIAMILLLSSAAALYFNMRGKLFLGDCGTYGVTFSIGLLVAHLHAAGMLQLQTTLVWFFFPVVDCVRLLISRPLRGISPFCSGRDHFHHILRAKYGEYNSLIIYVAPTAATSVIAALLPSLSLACLIGLGLYYAYFCRSKPFSLALAPADTATPAVAIRQVLRTAIVENAQPANEDGKSNQRILR